MPHFYSLGGKILWWRWPKALRALGEKAREDVPEEVTWVTVITWICIVAMQSSLDLSACGVMEGKCLTFPCLSFQLCKTWY